MYLTKLILNDVLRKTGFNELLQLFNLYL